MLDTERVTITARINGLLHREPSADLPPPPVELAVPDEPPALVLLAQAALEARPQNVAAQARVRASEANAASAQRANYPDLELMVAYDSMWDTPVHRWTAGVAIEFPIQRGKRAADVEAATARVAQARAEADHTLDEIRVDVTCAHRDAVEALHVVRLYDEKLLPAARAQTDAALAGFTTGANEFLAVIVAERSLRDIQLATFRARADAWRRQAALDRAVGRSAGGAP
jgi:outer membrane protein TolC